MQNKEKKRLLQLKRNIKYDVETNIKLILKKIDKEKTYNAIYQLAHKILPEGKIKFDIKTKSKIWMENLISSRNIELISEIIALSEIGGFSSLSFFSENLINDFDSGINALLIKKTKRNHDFNPFFYVQQVHENGIEVSRSRRQRLETKLNRYESVHMIFLITVLLQMPLEWLADRDSTRIETKIEKSKIKKERGVLAGTIEPIADGMAICVGGNTIALTLNDWILVLECVALLAVTIITILFFVWIIKKKEDSFWICIVFGLLSIFSGHLFLNKFSLVFAVIIQNFKSVIGNYSGPLWLVLVCVFYFAYKIGHWSPKTKKVKKKIAYNINQRDSI